MGLAENTLSDRIQEEGQVRKLQLQTATKIRSIKRIRTRLSMFKAYRYPISLYLRSIMAPSTYFICHLSNNLQTSLRSHFQQRNTMYSQPAPRLKQRSFFQRVSRTVSSVGPKRSFHEGIFFSSITLTMSLTICGEITCRKVVLQMQQLDIFISQRE